MKKEKTEKYPQVILASSSETRINILKKTFKEIQIKKHKINEKMEKSINKHLKANELAKHLAKKKAESISDINKTFLIIGCDQTLECNKKIISKPENCIQAKKNLMFLSGKKHKLHTCLYVLKEDKEFFIEEVTSELYFKKVSEVQIDKYLKENKETALNCVGSYKIEDNDKYNFLQIISGNNESILGFPIKKFIEKLESENT